MRYPEPNDFDSQRHLRLVRIRSDNGLVGWGKAVTMFEEARWGLGGGGRRRWP